MDKNLDVSTFRNGDPIPLVEDAATWASLTTGAYCYFNNDPANGAIYGKLYNWYAVNDPRGLAPKGWHVPTDAEWTTLIDCLGGTEVAGGKMKEIGTAHWNSPNIGATNSSGFTALPGNFRNIDGTYHGAGSGTDLWSSTEDGTTKAWGRALVNYDDSATSDNNSKEMGFSVRCLRD